MMIKKTLVCLIVLGMAYGISFASTVLLRSGERIEGEIINTSADEIYVQSGTDIRNIAYRDTQEVTDFSVNEVERGYPDAVAEGIEASGFSLKQAEAFVSREFTIAEIKEKLRTFKDFILERFSGSLKNDEKDVLGSIGAALEADAPVPIVPRGENPTPEELVRMYAPYQSDLHDKILHLMLRYLDQWIADVDHGNASFQEEERFLVRVLGETRLAVLRTVLPSLELMRDTVKRYLANLAASRHAAERAILAHQ